jgi:hypothetical protein
MNEFIAPFEVSSTLTDEVYQVRFSHIWNAIATRHSDTMDAKFFVNGARIVVGVALAGVLAISTRIGRGLTDREISFLAAECIRERLQQEDLRPLYDVSREEVLRLAEKAGLG